MRRRWCVSVAALALAGGSMLAFASVAAASSAAPRLGHVKVQLGGRAHRIRPFVSRRSVRGRRHRYAVTSSNWSGYAAHSGNYRRVSASWVEPRGHCSGSGHKYSSFWVGLDGFKSSSVEQTGSEVNCKGGRPKYSAWYEMFPKSPVVFSNRVRSGDHFHGSVTYNGRGRFTLRLSDTTRGWTRTEHKSLVSAERSSAEVIVEAPSSTREVLPLANFGAVHITNAKVNGSKIGNYRPTEIIMEAGATRKDSVSRLADGLNFSATWHHSLARS